jgi:hypothetical protein
MARAADERPGQEGGIDPAALRASVPSLQAIMVAKPVEAGPVQLACGKATAEQIGEIAKIVTGEVGDDERMAISPAIYRASRVYVVRLDTAGIAWYVGAVDGADSGVYNTVKTGDWRAGRPDLGDLLRLPVGFIAVVGSNGVEAVFNANNENVLQPS